MTRTIPSTMQAAFLLAPGEIEVRDVPVPTIGPGEILVRVTTALTCGTELKAYRQGHRLFRPPMALGHEFVGVVAAVGEGVTTVDVGDRVVCANSAPCETCPMCRRGQTNLCLRLPEFLLFGAFAEYVRVSASIVRHNTLRVPDDLSDQVAAFLEPFACVVQGVEGAAPQPGESVVVIGGTGPIGLLFLQLLRQAGANPIVAVGRKPHRLTLACRLGASKTIAASGADLIAAVAEQVGQPDLVIEITGIPELIEQATRMVRPGGRVILFGGSSPGNTASFDLGRIHYEEITIRGVFHHTPASVRRSLFLLASGAIDVEPLVSETSRLADVAEAMRRFDSGDTMKIAIRPD